MTNYALNRLVESKQTNHAKIFRTIANFIESGKTEFTATEIGAKGGLPSYLRRTGVITVIGSEEYTIPHNYNDSLLRKCKRSIYSSVADPDTLREWANYYEKRKMFELEQIIDCHTIRLIRAQERLADLQNI